MGGLLIFVSGTDDMAFKCCTLSLTSEEWPVEIKNFAGISLGAK